MAYAENVFANWLTDLIIPSSNSFNTSVILTSGWRVESWLQQTENDQIQDGRDWEGFERGGGWVGDVLEGMGNQTNALGLSHREGEYL